MTNVVNINDIVNEKIKHINIEEALNAIRTSETKMVIKALERNKFNSEEVCILVEEACRYENIEVAECILKNYKEILYFFHCDVLDVAVMSCNFELIEMVLDQYDDGYIPELKYQWSLDRAKANNKVEILNLIQNKNIKVN